MRMNKTAGFKGVVAGLAASLAVAATAITAVPGARAEPATGPSDELVKAVIDYAWAMIPTQFSNKDGNVIVVDKSKRDAVMVPMEVAREVVRVGRVSAHAQVCNLAEDQALNHRSLMRREVDKKIWTDQQKLWINQLHLTTVMILTGKLKAIENDTGKEVAVVESKEPANTCTEEQKKAVQEKIKAYVDAGPKLAPAVAPTATASTTPPTEAPAAAPAPKAAPLPTSAVPPAAAPPAAAPAAPKK
jgi:hypothetical protein